MIRSMLLAVMVLVAGCAGSRSAGPITDTPLLVRAMHARYADTWYETLVFTQQTYFLQPDSTVREETWREWMHAPGRLRIERGDPAAGNGTLFARDSTYGIRSDTVAVRRAGRNDLLTLGFDVYHQPPEETLAELHANGFSLEPFREDSWEGRPAYVFGTPETKEVWIDAERLVFVRLVEPMGQDAAQHQDVRFTDYEPLDDAWIAPTVEVWVEGRKVFWETYSDIRTGVPLDPSLFDPDRWDQAIHP